MSSAQDRRLVVAAFTKRAVAETPLTGVTTVPGGPAPAVAGKVPKNKGKPLSGKPSIRTASFNSELIDGINSHLEKMAKKDGGNWIQDAVKEKNVGKLHEMTNTPKGEKIPLKEIKAQKEKGGKAAQRAQFALNVRGLGKGGAEELLEMLDKASMCGLKHSKKPKRMRKMKRQGMQVTAADKETGELKPLAADQPVKKAPMKKAEPKESENEVTKKAEAPIGMPDAMPPVPNLGREALQAGLAGQQAATPSTPAPAPEAPGGMDNILNMLGQGLGTIGSKSMSGLGGLLGKIGILPGAQQQLNMWSQDPTVSKGVGGGVSALGAILIAYLIRRLMAGGGEGGMELSAAHQCDDLVKSAQNPNFASSPYLNPTMQNAMTQAQQQVASLPGYQNPQAKQSGGNALIGAAGANSNLPQAQLIGQNYNREAPKVDNAMYSAFGSTKMPQGVSPSSGKAQQQGVQRVQAAKAGQ